MNSDSGFTLHGDINANITPKDFAEPSDKCSGLYCCSEALHELLVLPFFDEDISNMFEIKTNLRIKRCQEKISWKRKRYSRKYKSLNFKQRAEATILIADQKKDVAPRNTDKEYPKHLDSKIAEDRSISSEEHKRCDLETNWTTEQSQLTHSMSPDFIDHFQNAVERESVHMCTSEDTKLPIYKKDSLVPEQAHLEAGCDINQHKLSTAVGKPDQIQETELFVKREEDSQVSEEAEKPEPTVISHLSQKIEIKDSGENNTEALVNDQILPEMQQSSGDKITRPNYFVAIPITNDQILDLIEDVQEHIVLKEPKLLRALIPAEKVHLTILVAHLKSEEDIRRAVSALMHSKEKVEKLLQGEQFGMPLHGIGQFNNQVIFIKITEHEQEILSKVAEAVTQCFTDAGVNLTGSKDFKPHLTFLKLSKVPSLRRKGFRKISSHLYKEYEDCSFGIEMFRRIDLCSMHKKNKLSGYYYCESSILLDMSKPQEVRGSITETKEDSDEPVGDIEACADCGNASSLAKAADKITLDITDAITISKEERIKETDGQPQASNTILGEKSCFQSTPDLFPAEPIASTAVDDGPEK